MTEVTDETIRDLIAAIDRLCEALNRRKKQVPINGIKWHPKDPTGAERSRRYRDRRRDRAPSNPAMPEAAWVIAID